MKYYIFLIFIAATLIEVTKQIPYGKFEFKGSEFYLNDEKFQIVGGEIHYSRIP